MSRAFLTACLRQRQLCGQKRNAAWMHAKVVTLLVLQGCMQILLLAAIGVMLSVGHPACHLKKDSRKG